MAIAFDTSLRPAAPSFPTSSVFKACVNLTPASVLIAALTAAAPLFLGFAACFSTSSRHWRAAEAAKEMPQPGRESISEFLGCRVVRMLPRSRSSKTSSLSPT